MRSRQMGNLVLTIDRASKWILAELIRNADSVIQLEERSLVFVEPHETYENFEEFLEYVSHDTNGNQGDTIMRPVKYAQTRKLY